MDLVDVGMIYVALIGVVLVAAPAVVVAALVWGALKALKPPQLLPLLSALGVLLAAFVWAAADPRGPADVLRGYLDAQTLGLDNLSATVRRERVDWLPYGLALLPYAVAVGALIGALGYGLPIVRFYAAKYLHLGQYELSTALKSYGADDIRRRVAKEKLIEYVQGFLAAGRITAVPSLPKRGKSKALAGMMRAMHDGHAWFGRYVTKGLKVYVASEEDQATFSGKLNEFDLHSGTVVSVHLPELAGRLGPDKWEGLTSEAYADARAKGAKVLIWDTLTSWAPWAFRGAEHMSFCLSVLKRKSQGMGTIVVLHNRKAGGDDEVVAMLGSIAGAAAYDVIAAFDRDKVTGICTLTVTGRLGEWEANARLDGVQYKPVDPEDQGPDPEDAPKNEPTVGQAAALVALKAADRPLTQKELADLLTKQQSQVSRDLSKLVAMGRVVVEGRGVEGDPKRYRLPQEGEAVVVPEEDVTVVTRAAVSGARAERATAARRPRGRVGRTAGPPE